MSKNRFFNFALASALGIATAMPMQARADDTEIYTGGSTIEGVRPNILIILDTSGSMSAFDGQSKDRLDRMKDAVTTLIDGVDNVNIGLMRFTDPGGPILFPVSKIDEDADAIAKSGQPDISVRVIENEDDAEELVPVTTVGTAPGAAIVGDVLLDSFYLELLHNPAFGDEVSLLKQVADIADDAEHASGFYNNSSGILEMVYTAAGTGTRTMGLRFTDVEGTPGDSDGATVLFSQLFVTPDSDRGGDLDVKIFGLSAGHMAAFPGSENSAGACPGAPGPGVADSRDIFCRLGLFTASQHNTGLSFAGLGTAPEDFTVGPPLRGNITNSIVTWNDVPDSIDGQTLNSPDISPIIQEIFDHPAWQATANSDDFGIFYTGTTASYRAIRSRNLTGTSQPALRVDYVPAGATSGRQVVALRFQNVGLPSAADVTSAVLELVPSSDSADPVSIRISAEKVADATPFTAYLNGTALSAPATDRISTRLSSRRTVETATWTLTGADPWTFGTPVQSVDLSRVIEEVAGTSGWCGGNDLVVFLEFNTPSTNTRRVFAHDADPTFAATLKIDYDKDNFSAGTGCVTDQVVRRINGDRDDAEERTSDGRVSTSGNVLETPTSGGTEQINGLIFRNMPIPAGASVTRAVLELASTYSESANVAGFILKAQKTTGQITQFSTSANNVSSRTSGANGTAGVTMTTPATNVSADEPFRTPDFASEIQTVVNQTDWTQGDDMLLTLNPNGAGQLDIRSHNADPSRAPMLVVDIQYNMGDLVPGDSPAPGVTTVRERLKEIVSGFTHNGYTPIVDTLYEAARYFRGEGVVYGKSRGTGGSSVERSTRLSHVGAYTAGSVSYPTGCNADDTNLSSESCRNQRIIGSPVYKSPIEESCQANFIVLLTDGSANHNNSVDEAQTMTGLTTCQSTFSNGDTVSGGEECGVDLARYLADNDQSSTVSGVNNVVTYTIGFNITTQFLRDIAAAGDGTFYRAGTEAQLLSTFQAIFADVLSRTTSFAAPSLSVNAFNRLEDRNEVYFSLFEPSANIAWDGNIKKFQLCQSTKDDCVTVSGAEVGDILDSRNPAVVAVGTDGRILESALSFWSASADGPNVLEGGTGRKIPAHGSRRVFTLTDDGLPAATRPDGTVTFYPSSEDLGANANKIIDADGDGLLDGLTGTAAAKETQTRELLGLATETLAEISEHINWIRGKDTDAQFDDTEFGQNRWAFGDPLHGNPLALTFGGTTTAPIIKLLAGTNDGGLRLINSNTGQEEWIFYPSELLGIQQDLRENPIRPQRVYGMDGTATPWIRDGGDEIGVIEPAKGDFVRVFMGMRRGGSSYYGLDITPTSTIAAADTTTLNNISPKLMWRIQGGSPEFAMLGQTWSRPVLASMLIGTTVAGQAERRTVLIVAGGYDPAQDSGFAKTDANGGSGNALYVVDASTGERLFFVGGPNAISRHSGSNGLEVDDMEFPMPSDVAAFDADGDGAVDRVYIGDNGGQMWRVDFFPNRAGGAGQDTMGAIAGMLASVSFEPSDADHLPDAKADERKFFYPPSVIQVRGGGSLSNEDYDLVSAVTGNRANPLNTNVRDRFYAFRDYYISSFVDANTDGLADSYTAIRGDLDGDPAATPVVNAKIFNEMLDFTSIDGPEDLTDPATFVTSAGYYLRLDTGGAGSGEKGLAAPTTLAGKLFFTTYLPQGVVLTDKCALAEGRGQLYGLDTITGSAVFNWDTPSDPTINRADRTYGLGAGIPSNPVPVFFPEKVMLLIGVGGGAETVDPDITVPQGRTYWFEQ